MSFQRGYGETTYDPEPRPRPDWVFDAPQTLTKAEADRQAWRAFWRGVVIGGLVVGAGFLAGAARGETIQIGRSLSHGGAAMGTTVSIAPSEVPGQLAVVTLDNQLVNDGGDTGRYPLVMNDLMVAVLFTWDADPLLGSDRMTVLAPAGVTCLPETCEVTVPEGLTGRVVLIDWRGM
jgi:hypothetical protein